MFLGVNYRSHANLVSFFKEILPIDNGLANYMVAFSEESGPSPVITKYSDEQEEAEKVLSKITDPEHTAIIARTNRQLFVFQRFCTVRGIRYHYLGKKDFFEQNEVKKLLSLAKDVSDDRPANTVLDSLIKQHGLFRIYSQIGAETPMESSPIENILSLVKMSVGKGTVKQFLDYLRRLTHGRKSKKGLTLSTAHMAKGREFEQVFIIGAKQGIMPHKDGEIDEERRIWYVSCSRPAKRLEISYYDSPSEFIPKKYFI